VHEPGSGLRCFRGGRLNGHRQHGPASPTIKAATPLILAIGVNIEEPPFLRGPGSYATFTMFDAETLGRPLFYAESAEARAQVRE